MGWFSNWGGDQLLRVVWSFMADDYILWRFMDLSVVLLLLITLLLISWLFLITLYQVAKAARQEFPVLRSLAAS